MRSFLLIPLLGALATSFTTSNLSAADNKQTESQVAVHVTKELATEIQTIKDKTGNYPASSILETHLNAIVVQMSVTVTGLPAGFSFKAAPTEASKGKSTLTNLSADVAGSTEKTLTIESIYASTTSKADIVAFSTSGTDLAVTYTLGDTNVSSTESTLVSSDVIRTTPIAANPLRSKPVRILPSPVPALQDQQDQQDQQDAHASGPDDAFMATLSNIQSINNGQDSAPSFTGSTSVNAVSDSISNESSH